MTLTAAGYALVIGGLAGVMGGMLGIGGGLIMVPLLNLLFGLDMHSAKNTSLAIVGAIGIVGTLEAARTQRFDWQVVGICALFACIGSPLGVRLARTMPTQMLTRWFAVFLIAVGIRYLVVSFRPEPPRPAPALDSQSDQSAAPAPQPTLDGPPAPGRQ